MKKTRFTEEQMVKILREADQSPVVSYLSSSPRFFLRMSSESDAPSTLRPLVCRHLSDYHDLPAPCRTRSHPVIMSRVLTFEVS
jgi:hypothetical protein